MTTPSKATYTFGECTLRATQGTLEVGGVPVELRPKSFEVLVYLVHHAGRPVPVHELLDAVWAGTVVTDDSVRQCIAELRKALGDEAHQIIVTKPRRGYMIAVPVTTHDEAAPRASGSIATQGRLRLAAIIAAMLAAASLWWLTLDQDPLAGTDGQDLESAALNPGAVTDEQGPSPLRAPSIAVLRFADMSPGQELAYLADGISEELLNTLTQSPSLRVIARTSSFAMSDRPVGEIAQALGVSHIVEGSVREHRGRIRITAQLIDADTSLHLWSQTYDRELDDVLDFQTEMAQTIGNLLSISLDPERRGGTNNPLAYRYFLQAQYHYARRFGDHRQLAREYYERALAEDPQFARAWIGLAATIATLLGDMGAPVRSPEEVAALRALQEQAVARALEHGSMLPEAHMRAVGFYLATGDRERMRTHLREAMALDPNHWLVLAARIDAHLLAGRTDRAAGLQRKLVLRDPVGIVPRRNLATMLYLDGRYAEALAEFAIAKELLGAAAAPDATAALIEGKALILSGQPEAALALFEHPGGDSLPLGRALAYLALGDDASAAALVGQAAGLVDENETLLLAAEVHASRGDAVTAVDHLLRLGTLECNKFVVPVLAYHSAFLRRLDGDPAWERWRDATGAALRQCAAAIDAGLAGGREPPTASLGGRRLASAL